MKRIDEIGLLGKFLTGAVFAFTLFAPLQAEAQHDPRSVALMPPYCPYTQVMRDKVPGGNNPEEIKRWTSVMGYMFLHMHHYCGALYHVNNATFFARNSYERQREYRLSLGEFDYVIRAAQPDFVLMPEFLTKRAESLIHLGRGAEAVADLERAMELKPDYWPPYAAMSDYYRDIGNTKLAREMLEKALSFSPSAKAVQERLADLDAGKDRRKTVPRYPRQPAAPQPPGGS